MIFHVALYAALDAAAARAGLAPAALRAALLHTQYHAVPKLESGLLAKW